ncbi:MAG TPA: hypothetical protein VNU26_07955 [Mycobacteriales bacterium]|nr:hypothetical protein [Mycobacteriales bacterium]
MTTEPGQRLDRLYARAEQKNEQRKAATVRRGPTSLVAVCLGVALVVGVTAAIDLRRLQSPRGASLAWVSAAVFGDCTAYRQLSTAGLDDDECLELRKRTEDARDEPDEIDIAVVEVVDDGDRARSVVRVRTDGRERRLRLDLRRIDGDWRVEPDEAVCQAVYCP